MATVAVEIKIDLGKYTSVMADKIAQGIAVDIRNKAKKKVRVDKGDLRNSIQAIKIASGSYEVFAQAPYAAAQEFGRPDLPKYGYTPYMRPAAEQAISNLDKIVEKAEIAARAASSL